LDPGVPCCLYLLCYWFIFPRGLFAEFGVIAYLDPFWGKMAMAKLKMDRKIVIVVKGTVT
jgi:hypothetical protein